jgi:hypothetical protein
MTISKLTIQEFIDWIKANNYKNQHTVEAMRDSNTTVEVNSLTPDQYDVYDESNKHITSFVIKDGALLSVYTAYCCDGAFRPLPF